MYNVSKLTKLNKLSAVFAGARLPSRGGIYV
jgi:hypothetical protein